MLVVPSDPSGLLFEPLGALPEQIDVEDGMDLLVSSCMLGPTFKLTFLLVVVS